MHDRLLKLPGKVQTHMLVVKMRPPDLEQLGHAGSAEDAASHGGDEGADDAHPVDASDGADGHDHASPEACPICGAEHEPLEITPDLGMLLAHLAGALAGQEPQQEVVQAADRNDGEHSEAEEDEDDGDGEADNADDGDDGADHDDDLHFMRF